MTTSKARSIVFVLGVTSLLLVSCRGDDHSAVFGYGKGPKGPENWGSIKPEWKTCSSGSKQSPINIVNDNATIDESLEPLKSDYRKAKATLVNNGYNVELRYDEGVGNVLVDGIKYSLQQLHWHTPSEHTIDGERFPLEMHMVHKTEDGKVAVIGTLYRLGNSDSFIKQFVEKFKELGKEKCSEKEQAEISVGVVKNNKLKRFSKNYYRYIGSLTTPPCSEEITWTILGKIREITSDQLAAIQAPLSGEYLNNSRPVQPLHTRTVRLSKKIKKNAKNDDDADDDDDDDKKDDDDDKKDDDDDDDKKKD